ncbi:MAG: TolC family protein, partial [bacterium]|nr:TolC family protein [bacterium]
PGCHLGKSHEPITGLPVPTAKQNSEAFELSPNPQARGAAQDWGPTAVANQNDAGSRGTAAGLQLAAYHQESEVHSSPPAPETNATLVEPAPENLVQALAHDPSANAPAIEALSGEMSLDDFLSIAMTHNPSLRELAFATQKAAGYRAQVGLRPNPVLGYQAMQLADEGTDQHVFFAEQEFVTGQKLDLNRRVLNETLRAQRLELDTQQFRVTTDIKVLFYETLAEQTRVQLISEFESVLDAGYNLAKLRAQALEGTRVDLLQAKIQRDSISVDLSQAELRFQAAFRELAAVAGQPSLPYARLMGQLPETIQEVDWTQLSASLVERSPEYQAAQARISRARANLTRQGVQPIPNLLVQLGTGFDNATDAGMINLQVGAPLPVHNKNQGNIASAQAEYCRAVAEAERIANAIRARTASISKLYDAASAAVLTYSQEILPDARETLELAETAYEAGESNFLQVLVARQTFFETNLRYLDAQQQLAQAQARLDGFALSGSLDNVRDESGDDSLRGMTFGQQ